MIGATMVGAIPTVGVVTVAVMAAIGLMMATVTTAVMGTTGVMETTTATAGKMAAAIFAGLAFYD
jgi:hypothetical protein